MVAAGAGDAGRLLLMQPANARMISAPERIFMVGPLVVDRYDAARREAGPRCGRLSSRAQRTATEHESTVRTRCGVRHRRRQDRAVGHCLPCRAGPGLRRAPRRTERLRGRANSLGGPACPGGRLRLLPRGIVAEPNESHAAPHHPTSALANRSAPTGGNSGRGRDYLMKVRLDGGGVAQFKDGDPAGISVPQRATIAGRKLVDSAALARSISRVPRSSPEVDCEAPTGCRWMRFRTTDYADLAEFAGRHSAKVPKCCWS